ncbi:MAG: alpha/beta fold hydrolase, partial [Dehalococcoidia bacterium]
MKVRLDDGIELFYRVDDFTDPWTEPETVVLHHGMAKSHKLWYAWVPIIARHYRVLRYDMRGMGQSSVPEPGYPWSVDNFAADLLEFADKLELEKFHLIGETVGGSISMRFATLHQERLRSLTACTSPTSFDDPHHGESADQIEREGVAAWVENTIGRRLDPQIVD